jgi:hypothetical protein
MRTCSPGKSQLHDLLGVPGDKLADLTTAALGRCFADGRLNVAQRMILAEHGPTGRPGRTCFLARHVWDRAIDILETEMNGTVFPTPVPLNRPDPPFFYGRGGTPFADAANAWWWTLDCLEARASGSRGCSALRAGRPCEPDDVVNALRRLDIPRVHARTFMAWGKQRTLPTAGTEARRLWDEVMLRLDAVLCRKGIVKARPTEIEIIDLPLTALHSVPSSCRPVVDDVRSGGRRKVRA